MVHWLHWLAAPGDKWNGYADWYVVSIGIGKAVFQCCALGWVELAFFQGWSDLTARQFVRTIASMDISHLEI